MDKEQYTSNMLTNLRQVQNSKLSSSSEYLCPICLKPCALDELTDEHVPQHSLGGHKMTLTCKECNSKSGSEVDVYLTNTIEQKERRLFLPGTDRKTWVLGAEGKLSSSIRITPDGIELVINPKRNKPELWAHYLHNVLKKDAISAIILVTGDC